MKGHRFHVKRKIKEKLSKFKKIEASMIKRLLRISSHNFFSSSLELSLFSHTLAHLEHSWSTLALEKGKQKEEKERKEKKISRKEELYSSCYNEITCK